MRFIHLADCHLDGFREEKLALLGEKNFSYVIEQAIQRKVDFVIIAGDLFNTAIPRMNALKFATTELKKLQDADIPVYAIAGSHDYSPQGKTILEVLESAGLLTLVMKGEQTESGSFKVKPIRDKKTNTLFTGIDGRKGMLDKGTYHHLDVSEFHSATKKIFLFHTTIEELKTPSLQHIPGESILLLPQGFDYYAGGHVHITQRYSDDQYKNVVYPGPTFPNSFSELEELEQGSFVYVEDETITHEKIPGKPVLAIHSIVENKTPLEIQEEIIEKIKDCDNHIVLLRIQGTIKEGSIQDISFQDIFSHAYQQGAFVVLKNTSKLQSAQLESVEDLPEEHGDIEQQLIKEQLNTVPLEGKDQEKLIKEIFLQLDTTQQDGETKSTFQQRILEKSRSIFEEKK